MNSVLQFVLYNLLPSLVAGLLVWLVVHATISLFRVQYGPLRLCLLYAPMVKSILVLLGLDLVLPWPRQVFATWQAGAVSLEVLLPILLVWAGVAILARQFLIRRAQELALHAARPAERAAPRLSHSLDRVTSRFRACPTEVTGEMIRCVKRRVPRPQLMIADHGLTSPLALVAEAPPTVVFPADLIPRLDDDELDGALAHELAHLMLRSPVWCSPSLLHHFTSVSPVAWLITTHLKREEEKACDDMAVAALGQPEIYASMLLKSYRFAVERSNPWAARLQVLPQLLGLRPMITERVERLLQGDPPQNDLRLQALTTCLLWTGLLIIVF